MAQIALTERGPADGGNFECHWSNAYLAAHLISDVGRKREHNEDSCILCAPEDKALRESGGYMIAVADGMGGAVGGEHASHLALSTFTEQFYAGTEDNVPDKLLAALQSANRAVFEEAEEKPEYYGMGTTLSAISILGDNAYIGQVGDSRVYLLRAQAGLKQITEDHSLVAEQVRNGIISEEEARNHSLKNLITRAVGIKDVVEADLFSMKLQRGDTILICSDGLCNMIEDDEIAEAMSLSSLQASARVLVGKALEAGGADNISVAVIRVVDAPPKSDLHKGGEEVQSETRGLRNFFKRLLS